MRIAAFPAKIARWADADGFNEAFVLHWRKCFSIRSRSKLVRTAAGGTPPFPATPTPQRRISNCRIEWASGSMLMRHPAVSAVPRRNAFSAVHLRMLLTPPRNAPSSPAALAAMSTRPARPPCSWPRSARSSGRPSHCSAVQRYSYRRGSPTRRSRGRAALARGFRHRWLPPSGCVCGDISPWDHTANRGGSGIRTGARWTAGVQHCPGTAKSALASAPLKTGKVA